MKWLAPTKTVEKREPAVTVNFATPSISAQLPLCAQQSCQNYLNAGAACASSTASLEQCYCSNLSFPTICSSACTVPGDLSSLAIWYWNLCPSQMDSSLGQIALSSNYILPGWALVAVTGASQTTGYNCYLSSQCASLVKNDGPTSTQTFQITPTPGDNPGEKNTNIRRYLPAIVILPIFVLAVIITLLALLLRARSKKSSTTRSKSNGIYEVSSEPRPTAILSPGLSTGTATSKSFGSSRSDRFIYAFMNPGPRYFDAELTAVMIQEIKDLSLAAKTQNSNPKMPIALRELEKRLRKIEDLLTCPVCDHLFHHPVSLIPNITGKCSHEICGHCIVPLLRESDECPADRAQVDATSYNGSLNTIVQVFLQEFPDLRPSESEIRDWDAIYSPGSEIYIKHSNYPPELGIDSPSELGTDGPSEVHGNSMNTPSHNRPTELDSANISEAPTYSFKSDSQSPPFELDGTSTYYEKSLKSYPKS